MTLPCDFPWRRGMTAILPDGSSALVIGAVSDGIHLLVISPRHGERPVPLASVRPDPNDGATVGALLEEVRKKHGLPDLYAKPLLPGGWVVTRPFTRPDVVWYDEWALTEFDALLAAWNARPGKP